MKIFPNSAGWNEKGPTCAQRRAPLISRPMPGTTGSSRSTTPISPSVYVYAFSCRSSRTNHSVRQNAASPTSSHIACSRAIVDSPRATMIR